MKSKLLCLGMVLLFLFVGVLNLFAEDGLSLIDNGDGSFMIEDSNKGICILVEMKPTNTSGVFEFICDGSTVEIVTGATQIIAALIDIFGGGGGVASTIAGYGNSIYTGACQIFNAF